MHKQDIAIRLKEVLRETCFMDYFVSFQTRPEIERKLFSSHWCTEALNHLQRAINTSTGPFQVFAASRPGRYEKKNGAMYNIKKVTQLGRLEEQ